MQNMRFWGVVVKPGEIEKCDPGQHHCVHISQIVLEDGKPTENVQVFVQANHQRFLLGTLSVEKNPHIAMDIVLEKKFELLHSSKSRNISFTGYHFKDGERSNSTTNEGDESDDEVPLAIPLYPNPDDEKNITPTHGSNKPTTPILAAVPSSKRKATEGAKSSKRPNDSEDIGSGHDKNDKGVNRPLEIPLKSKAPTSKKNKTGSGTGKKPGDVHVATPHPAKRIPANDDKAKISTGYTCSSCNKSFHSYMALQSHSVAKHGSSV